MRSAYAVAQADILTEAYKEATETTVYTESGNKYVAYYDISGKMVKNPPSAYGKSSVNGMQDTADLPKNAYFNWDGKETGKVIKVTLDPAEANGKYVTIGWEAVTTS